MEVHRDIMHRGVVGQIQKLCDDLCMGRMVVFLGKRAQDTLPYYYSAADVLVMPSHYESFGMVALEAMACGVPVIASDVSVMPEIVGEAGELIDPFSVDSTVRGMLRVVEDEDRRHAMIALGLDRAGDFSWEDSATSIWKALVSVVNVE